MSPVRLVPPLLLLLAPLVTFAWRAEDFDASPGPVVYEPLVPYVVEPIGGAVVIALDPRHRDGYVLVVGSLADSSETFPVVVEPAGATATLSPVHEFDDRPTPRPGVAGPEDSTISMTLNREGLSDLHRVFHVHVTDGTTDDARHYARVDARLVARSETVRVFLDENVDESELAAGLLEEITRSFDDEIVPRVTDLVGPALDVDGDATLAVVLTPWLGRLEGGRVSVDGFVRPSDFRPDVAAPFGDSADVVFLNPALRPGRRLRAVLAHEFAHVVAISQRRRAWLERTGSAAAGGAEEDWLNEAIAHVVETRVVRDSPNLVDRVDRFLETPETTPLVVPDYHARGLWRDEACRGATFEFLDHCVGATGPGTLSRLTRTTDAGVRNLEIVTGRPFDDLFRAWAVSMAGTAAGSTETTSIRTRHYRPEEPVRLELRGTANAFIRIGPTREASRIRVAAPVGARLQVTLLPATTEASSRANSERGE